MLPVTIGAFNGARSSEQVLVWSARSMGANKLRMLWDWSCERHVGNAQRHPYRTGAVVHPAGVRPN